MDVQFFCPRWGSEDLSWEIFCSKVEAAGYDGIEYAISADTPLGRLDEIWDTVTRHGLHLIAQHYDTNEAGFEKHAALYENWLKKLTGYPVTRINSQTGKDFFSFEQNRELIAMASASGLDILHETHRGKFSFSAHTTRVFLERIPELRLTLDASHWVCVAESYLEDQPMVMELAISRTEHIHARVGYVQGPQVPDLRAREWQVAVEKHLSWWDRVAGHKKKENGTLTITTEFGPFPYGVNPAVTQWEQNLYMLQLLKSRYV